MRYRPEIDGLRALAVVPVVLFHAGIPPFSGGFVGVDVFFVISGFLITSIIVNDLDRGAFSLLRFWERRVRRILPALLVTVALTFIVGWLAFTPSDFQFLGQTVASQSIFLSNVLFWRETGYFGAATDPVPLLHTWSLSLEEQFYIIFPLSLLLLTKLTPRFRWPVVAIVSAASLVANLWAIDARHTTAAFFLLPFRAWELGLGALLAMWGIRHGTTSIGSLRSELGTVAGLSLIAFAVFSFDKHTPFPGTAAIVPVLGTTLVLYSNHSKISGSARLLAWRPLVFLGLISYSLYLWHLPILVLLAYASGQSPEDLRLATRTVAIIASVALAYGSWRFVETPVRSRTILADRRLLFGVALSGLAMLAALGLASDQASFPPQPGRDALANLAAAQESRSARQKACIFDSRIEDASTGPDSFCVYGDVPGEPRFIVWGDSHADSLLPVFDALATEHGVPGIHASYSSCPPVLNSRAERRPRCQGFNESVMSLIEDRDIESVILVGSWANYYLERDRIIPLGYSTELSPKESSLIALRETVRVLLAKGLDVWLIRDVPRLGFNPTRRLYVRARMGGDLSRVGESYSEYLMIAAPTDRLFRELEAAGARIVDLPATLCVGDFCPVLKDGTPLYRDSQHLSVAGSLATRPAFDELFSELKLRGADGS